MALATGTAAQKTRDQKVPVQRCRRAPVGKPSPWEPSTALTSKAACSLSPGLRGPLRRPHSASFLSTPVSPLLSWEILSTSSLKCWLAFSPSFSPSPSFWDQESHLSHGLLFSGLPTPVSGTIS